MSFIGDSRKPGGPGYLPLRHEGYDQKGFDLEFRAQLIAVKVKDRKTEGEDGLGQWVLDRDSTGDIVGALCWPKDSRPMPGWSWAWPVKLAGGSGGGGGDTPTEGGGRRDIPSVDPRNPPVRTPPGSGSTVGPDTPSGGGAQGNAGASGMSGPAGGVYPSAQKVGGGSAEALNSALAGAKPKIENASPVGAGNQAGGGQMPSKMVGAGSGFPQFSYRGNNSIEALSGIPGTGPGSGFAQFSMNGGRSLEALTGIQGVGTGSGFAGFSMNGSSSLSSLTGMQGVGNVGGFGGWSVGGSSSTSALSGLAGVGFGGGFATFRMPADPYRNPYNGSSSRNLGNVFGNGANPADGGGMIYNPDNPPSSDGDNGAAGENGVAGAAGDAGAAGGGAGRTCGTFQASQHEMLPLNGTDFSEDRRYKPISPPWPKDSGGKPIWKLAKGTIGVAVAATNEEKQVEYFLPTDSRLIAAHGGDHAMGSLVCDLTSDFEIDAERTAHLQSAFWVLKKPPGSSGNALAFNIGLTGCGDSRGGYVIDGKEGSSNPGDTDKVVAQLSVGAGGFIDVGTGKCKHKAGQDGDKHPVVGAHISTKANFRKDDAHDGPIRFEETYLEGQDKSVVVPVHLAWTGSDWALWTTADQDITPWPTDASLRWPKKPTRYPQLPWNPPIRPGQPTPRSGGGGTILPHDPRYFDKPGERPPVPTVDPFDNRFRSGNIVSTALGMATQIATQSAMVASAGMASFPQNYTPGGTDLTNPTNGSREERKGENTKRPVSGQMAAFGAQGGPSGGASSGSSSNTGASGDPWVYTQKPGEGKYACGTGPGGWCIIPPEISLADSDTGYAPNGITKSETVFGVGPGAKFFAGLPDLAVGSVKRGFTWYEDGSGNLQFDSYDSGGVGPRGVFKIGNVDENLYWRSGSSNYGVLAHNNTNERTWVFPDLDCRVAGLLIGTGAPASTAPEGTFYWDETGNALYVNNDSATSWTSISGGGGITGSGAANQLTYWTSATNLAGDAGLTVDAANDRLILTGTGADARLRIAYDGTRYEDTYVDVNGNVLRTLTNAVTTKGFSFTGDGSTDVRIALSNSSATAASATYHYLSANNTTGDVYTALINTGSGGAWSLGIDGSDSNAFNLSRQSAGPTTGSARRWRVTTADQNWYGDDTGTVTFQFNNANAGAGAAARILAQVPATSTSGDAFFSAEIASGVSWSWGLDNSDSDAWVLARSAALGTSNVLRTDASDATFSVGVIVSGLTASRLTATDASKRLASVADLTAWIAGTANRVTVTNDGDGTITLSGPQDLAAASSPTFAGLTLSGLTNTRVLFAGASGVISDDAGMTYNSTTDVLTLTGGAILSNLTASRLMASDGSKQAVSVADLTAWIAGTANRVTVTSDGDGTITLSGPQDIHTGASPTFTGLTLSGLTNTRVLYAGASGVVSNDSGMTYDAATDTMTLAGDLWWQSGTAFLGKFAHAISAERTWTFPDLAGTVVVNSTSQDIDNNARVAVRKNTGGADVGERRRLNFIEGSNITLTISDDGASEEVDIQIAGTTTPGTGEHNATRLYKFQQFN